MPSENPYQRPQFIAKVMKLSLRLGHSEIFMTWLARARNGDIHSILSLKDYGLVPYTIDEMKATLAVYSEFIGKQVKSRPIKVAQTQDQLMHKGGSHTPGPG